MGRGDRGFVYSSEHGELCPECERPVAQCTCAVARAASGGKAGNVRVGRETKGRKGGGVTVITGVPLTPTELKALAKELKKKCGSGGTIRDGVIEIQGDHRDTLVTELSKRGWSVKRSGG